METGATPPAVRITPHLMFGLLVIFLGIIFTLDNLDIADARTYLRYWPAGLIAIGLAKLWQVHAGHGSAIGGVNRGSNSNAFRGGELTAVMGGCEIDLRQAAINGEAVIDVFAMWGGIEIRVPENWRVIGRVTPLLGGFEDKTRPPQGVTTHTLIIRGMVLMGGVDVGN